MARSACPPYLEGGIDRLPCGVRQLWLYLAILAFGDTGELPWAPLSPIFFLIWDTRGYKGEFTSVLLTVVRLAWHMGAIKFSLTINNDTPLLAMKSRYHPSHLILTVSSFFGIVHIFLLFLTTASFLLPCDLCTCPE